MKTLSDEREIRMKLVRLIDNYGELRIKMCEKHFKQYRKHMDNAVLGGTSYLFETTTKRGCELCSRKKDEGG